MTAAGPYAHYDLHIDGQVGRILLRHPTRAALAGQRCDPHVELADILQRLHQDPSVRVVVLKGSGELGFSVPEPMSDTGAEKPEDMPGDAALLYASSSAIIDLHQLIAQMNKPVVACVNGDAIGFGCSIVLACDLIYADEQARIVDNHLGMGEVAPFVTRFGVTPGDGGAALAPLHFSPARAKEFLMLARPYTGRELADLGIINAAVPANALDDLVEERLEALLRRSAYALAWTKRVANRHVVEQLNRTLDAGVAYELVNLYQLLVGRRDYDALT